MKPRRIFVKCKYCKTTVKHTMFPIATIKAKTNFWGKKKLIPTEEVKFLCKRCYGKNKRRVDLINHKSHSLRAQEQSNKEFWRKIFNIFKK